MIDARRRPYKRLVTASAHAEDGDIHRGLSSVRPMEDEEYLRRFAEIINPYTGGRGVRAGEILLDVPWKRRDKLGGMTYVYKDDGRTPWETFWLSHQL